MQQVQSVTGTSREQCSPWLTSKTPVQPRYPATQAGTICEGDAAGANAAFTEVKHISSYFTWAEITNLDGNHVSHLCLVVASSPKQEGTATEGYKRKGGARPWGHACLLHTLPLHRGGGGRGSYLGTCSHCTGGGRQGGSYWSYLS